MSAATMTNSKNYHAGNTRNSRPRQGARKATAYCKVCHDAGRPHSEYTSHFVKDKKGPDGKVVCPLLLNQECRYCHEKGHTPKECPEIKAKAERKRQYEQRQRELKSRPDAQGFRSAEGLRSQRRQRPAATKPRVPSDPALAARMQRANLFAALRDSSSDEEAVPTKEAFPTLGNKSAPAVVAPPEPKLTGWAALAAKPAPPKPVVRVQEPATTTSRDAWDNESEYSYGSETPYEREEREAQWKLDYDRMKNMSWADMCDSDFDEEERGWGDYSSDEEW